MSECTGCRYLVILVRGWGPAGRLRQGLIDELCKQLPKDSRVLQPQLDMGLFSTRNPADLEQEIVRFINDAVDEHRPQKIVLFGFSTGCLLVRGALLQALSDKLEWVKQIDRVLYAGGILRGWSITTATPFAVRLMMPIIRLMVLINKLAWMTKVTWLHSFNVHWNVFFYSSAERGTPYVVEQQLRFLRFLRYSEHLSHVRFIYLIGTRDRYVSPADTVEILPLIESWYIELPGLSHFEIINPGGIGKRAVEQWRDTMKTSLLGGDDELQRFSISGDYIDDYFYHLDLPVQNRVHTEVEHVVILLHGVRDDGFWTKRIGAKIKQVTGSYKVRTPTPSYGFFSVLNFLSVFARKSKVRWFLEMYVTLKIHYPNADISFVGHSNGTYLALQAMKLCKSIRFRRMYLAGCVARTDYQWSQCNDQVSEKVVNVINANDYIISTSPGFIEYLGWSFLNVGGAGQQGFQAEYMTDKVKNYGPFNGGHAGAISEPYWPAIARFINGAEFEPPKQVVQQQAQAGSEANGKLVVPLRVLCLAGLVVLLMSFCYLVVLLAINMTAGLWVFLFFWLVLIWAARNV